MTDLARAIQSALASPDLADRIEPAGLVAPQDEAPVFHRFGPGIYVREVHMRAGNVAVGHHHRHGHLNIMVKGKLRLLTADGPVELEAPQTFVAPPGRKVAYIIEDTIWQNVYATTETDVDKLDAWIFDKSEVAQAVDAMREVAQEPQPELPEWPKNASGVRPGLAIRSGGIWATAPFEAGAVVGGGGLGAMCSHSSQPTARLERLPTGATVLVTTRRLPGCVGGSKGDRITVDYHDAARVLRGEA